jgi:hypothetical protein
MSVYYEAGRALAMKKLGFLDVVSGIMGSRQAYEDAGLDPSDAPHLMPGLAAVPTGFAGGAAGGGIGSALTRGHPAGRIVGGVAGATVPTYYLGKHMGRSKANKELAETETE